MALGVELDSVDPRAFVLGEGWPGRVSFCFGGLGSCNPGKVIAGGWDLAYVSVEVRLVIVALILFYAVGLCFSSLLDGTCG